ncbi:hypothetical protein [Rhodoferax sp.]|uniref:hypothetical protein n=1 Tax=Rhodoferax sp. TaxID=50421 RepID=UPI002736DFB0|nr:hypothetical protein [Rhodoferax sp.]MDP3192347.1 hypothetical protein [Rhodoferax sp.]
MKRVHVNTHQSENRPVKSYECIDLESRNSTVKKNYPVIVLLIFIMAVWLLMFTLGLSGYSGSKAAYAMFSIVTGTMLVTGFQQRSSYGYLFLTLFLWLGFWLKLTIHTILNYPFVEPVGSFLGGAEAWDEVLYVATVACLGVMLGKFLYDYVSSPIGTMRGDVKPAAPPWYEKSRKWVWAGLIVTAIAVLIVNMRYGLHQIGLVPRTVLMWPLNAVVAWLLNIGLGTGTAVLLWWEIALKKNVTVPIYAIVAEAFLSSVSILSRAIYIFHALPQLWAAYQFRHTFSRWSRTKTVLLAVVFVSLLAVSISAVTTLRNYLYQSGVYSSTAFQVAYSHHEVIMGAIYALQSKIDSSTLAERPVLLNRMRELQVERLRLEQILAAEKVKLSEVMQSGAVQSKILLNEFGYQITEGVSTRILQLSVDRWIGLEGLMSVQSYPEKNISLLWNALIEKPEVGKPDTYQTVSNSIYLKSDGTKFNFASLPGAAAFLYYGNSLPIVMLGMMFFSLVVLVAEFLINALTSNPILCSLYGALLASNVAQFGVSPRLSLPFIFMLACGILLVWLIHTSFFTLVLRKLKLFNDVQACDE